MLVVEVMRASLSRSTPPGCIAPIPTVRHQGEADASRLVPSPPRVHLPLVSALETTGNPDTTSPSTTDHPYALSSPNTLPASDPTAPEQPDLDQPHPPPYYETDAIDPPTRPRKRRRSLTPVYDIEKSSPGANNTPKQRRKRVRASGPTNPTIGQEMRLDQRSLESNGRRSTNGSSQNGSSPHTNGSTASTGTNGFRGDAAVVPDTTPFYGHDREEVTRILLQSLSDLGYKGAADQLSRESGYQLEIPSVAAFRSAVQDGDWSDAELILLGAESDVAEDGDGGVSLGNGHTGTPLWRRSKNGHANGRIHGGLPLAEGADVVMLKFLLRQQKYLELLERRDVEAALGVLRNELTPLKRDIGRIHTISALMMCSSPAELRALASWDGAQGSSRSDLLSTISRSISPSVMIPEHRLAELFTSVQTQREHDCLYHNTITPPTLYTDHECSPDDFPLQTLTELRTHSDEVWTLDFNSSGSLLASAGKDGVVMVYDTTRWKLVHEFREHERNVAGPDARGVCYLAFSPDDRYLVTCSQNNELTVFDLRTGRMAARADHFDYCVTAAAWLPDSLTFVVGTQSSERPLGLYSMRSSQFSTTSGVTPVLLNNEIHSFRDPPWDRSARANSSNNSFRITDVAVSKDGTRMAATTLDKRVLVYDLLSKQRLSEWVMEEKLTSINFSAEGDLLLVNMNEGRVWALDSVTGEEVMRYEGAGQREFVIRSCFGGAGENFVASGSEDSRVYIWRRQTGMQVAALEGHGKGTVNAVVWHPTNPGILASAGDDRRVYIWCSANYFRQQQAAAEGNVGMGQAEGYPYASYQDGDGFGIERKHMINAIDAGCKSMAPIVFGPNGTGNYQYALNTWHYVSTANYHGEKEEGLIAVQLWWNDGAGGGAPNCLGSVYIPYDVCMIGMHMPETMTAAV
nr:hypothetical protein B0A51_08070 [Rachicladosporium sp. CCFEE 5018]